jgi:hypothetical protein
MSIHTRRKLSIQVRWLGVTNTQTFPITSFQSSLNTTEHMVVFGEKFYFSIEVRIYRPHWYSKYCMIRNIWGSNSGRG